MATKKRVLTKNTNDKVISGVLAGLADYFELDPTLVRIIFLALLAFSGFVPGIFAYFLAVLIMPEK